MRLRNLEAAVADAVEPPVTDEEVVSVLGDLVLESPQGVEETVAEVLARQGAETFEDAPAVALAIRGNLSGSFVGRRRYDDRSPNVCRQDCESF